MDAYGILSLIFGILGIFSSYWYIGIVPCAVGLVLGIVGMVDSYMDSKPSLMGAQLSVFGAIATIFFIVSDIDSDKLVINSSKFGGEKIETVKNDDFMRFHREGWAPDRHSVEVTAEEPMQEMSISEEQDKITPYWVHDENEVKPSGETVMQPEEQKSVQPEAEIQDKRIEEPEKQKTGPQRGILYSDENFSISFSGLEKRDIHDGYDIKFEVENFTNRTINVQLRETSINGYMANVSLNIEVSPNKKGAGGALVFGDDSERTPYENVNSIETKFHMFYDTDFGGGYDTENIVVMGS